MWSRLHVWLIEWRKSIKKVRTLAQQIKRIHAQFEMPGGWYTSVTHCIRWEETAGWIMPEQNVAVKYIILYFFKIAGFGARNWKDGDVHPEQWLHCASSTGSTNLRMRHNWRVVMLASINLKINRHEGTAERRDGGRGKSLLFSHSLSQLTYLLVRRRLPMTVEACYLDRLRSPLTVASESPAATPGGVRPFQTWCKLKIGN